MSGQQSSAEFSPCQNFRYQLTRRWEYGSGMLTFCMLNPSTADASKNDPTVTKCIQWAKSLGFAGLHVVNIFAWRSTDPMAIHHKWRAGSDAIGPENDEWILSTARGSSMLICAWGNHGKLANRGMQVRRMLKDNGVMPHCLKVSKEGQPVHPLYQPYSLTPKEWQ